MYNYLSSILYDVEAWTVQQLCADGSRVVDALRIMGYGVKEGVRLQAIITEGESYYGITVVLQAARENQVRHMVFNILFRRVKVGFIFGSGEVWTAAITELRMHVTITSNNSHRRSDLRPHFKLRFRPIAIRPRLIYLVSLGVI